jgi:acetyltransferase-like isoleucine patch superfamily enzyme
MSPNAILLTLQHISGVKRGVKRFLVRWFLTGKRITYSSLPAFGGKCAPLRITDRLVLGSECVFNQVQMRIIMSESDADVILEIGDGCFINDGASICAAITVSIGKHCKIGTDVLISDTNFWQIQEDDRIQPREVAIGPNVWIGARAIILPGVAVGAHSVIGAGAVVRQSMPQKVQDAGSLAKVMSTIECRDDWIRR